MKNLIPIHQNGSNEILVTGRDLHEFLEVGTEYRHWIKRMIDYGFIENIDYVEKIEQVHGQKRTRTYEQQNHHLKLDMAKEISMIQRNEKGKQARRYFIEIERRWNSPEMIIKRAMEIQQQKVSELTQKMKEQEKLVGYAETLLMTENSILVRELAKMASKQGVKIGERRLWKLLREWKLIFPYKNEPYQKYIDRDYFEMTQGVKNTNKGPLTWSTMRVKPKGQKYIINRLKQEIMIEQ